MKIVNTSSRRVSLFFRDGRTINIPESGGSVTLADSDFTYLDDTAVSLALFSSGVLLLQATDGGAWGGRGLPTHPSQQPAPSLTPVVADEFGGLRRSDNQASVGVLKTPAQSVTVGGFGTPVVGTNYSLGTFAFLRQFPFEFTAVQVGIFHEGGSGACAGIKAILSSTDDVGTGDYTTLTAATVGRFTVPRVGGVLTNTLSADAGVTGWQQVLFGGAGSATLADAGAAGKYTAVLSDVIPVVAREDAAEPGWYNLIGRITFDATTSYTYSNVNGLTTGTGMKDFFGGPRIMFLRRSGDAVTDPTAWGDTATPSNSSAVHLPLFFVLHGVSGQKFVVFAGDSRFSTSSETPTQRYKNLPNYTRLVADDLQVAISAGAGWTSAKYFELTKTLIESGMFKGGTLNYLAYAINDGPPTATTIALAKRRAAAIADTCAKHDVQLMYTDGFPETDNGWSEAELSRVLSLQAWCAGIVAQTMSPIREFGDAAANWVPGVAYDDSHMLNSGYQAMGEKVHDVIVGSGRS